MTDPLQVTTRFVSRVSYPDHQFSPLHLLSTTRSQQIVCSSAGLSSTNYTILPTSPIEPTREFSVEDFQVTKNLSMVPFKVGRLFYPTDRENTIGYLFYSECLTYRFLFGLSYVEGSLANSLSKDSYPVCTPDRPLEPVLRTHHFSVFYSQDRLAQVFCGLIDKDLDEKTKL